MNGPQDLQVIAAAFEQAAETFTHQGSRVAALAGYLVVGCAPLGDGWVGGDQCGALAQQATSLGRALNPVGTGGCTRIAHSLQQLLATFQEADRRQAANPRLARSVAGGAPGGG